MAELKKKNSKKIEDEDEICQLTAINFIEFLKDLRDVFYIY